MFRRINVSLVVWLIFATLFTPAQAAPDTPNAPGDLDSTFAGFGAGGKVTLTGLDMFPDELLGGTALAADGKVVAAGFNATHLLVWRYLPDGQPDPSFGNGGVFAYAPVGYDAIPNDVAIQADGKIVIVGENGADDFLVMRVLADGSSLDASFNGDGYVFTDFGGKEDGANAVLIQLDGKIVVCGYANLNSGDFTDYDYGDFAVARYRSDGALDTSFSNDGKTAVDFNNLDICNDLAQQADGKLVLAGESNGDFALARLEINGSPDTDNGDGGFGGDGKVTTSFDDEVDAYAVAIQSDNKIVALGHTDEGDVSYVTRYQSNGALDGTFGSGGKLTIPYDALSDLVLQPDGRMVALGFNTNPSGIDFVFYRLNTDGSFDTTFGDQGSSNVDFGAAIERGTDLVLLPDGRILGFGSISDSESAPITGLGLARLWPDGTLDNGGKQTHVIAPDYNETPVALAVQPDGSLLTAGELSAPGNTSSDAFVTRFHSDGQVDTSFGDRGTVRPPHGFLTPNFRGARAIALQPDGKIVIAGYSDIGDGWLADFLVTRWNPDGTPDHNFSIAGGFTTVNFSGHGDDYGTALALAPDGKIVVAGNVWNGSRQVWGVARLTITGTLDVTFGPNHDGMAYVDFNTPNSASAVVVQPDGKIIVGGAAAGDFFIQRLLANGAPDPSFGSGGLGFIRDDMGGTDVLSALVLDGNGQIYAAGTRTDAAAHDDMVLAHYLPDGVRAACSTPAPCGQWATGKVVIDFADHDLVNALALRSDNQLMVAGCAGLRFAGAQLSTAEAYPTPFKFNTQFIGESDCAYAVRFTNNNQLVMAGWQHTGLDFNMALARFQTAVNTPSTYRMFIPLARR